MTTSCYSYTVT